MTTSTIGEINQRGLEAALPTLTEFHDGYIYFAYDTKKTYRWDGVGLAWELEADANATAYTDEQAQDAIGAMVDASLSYDDSTPSLGVSDVLNIPTTEMDTTLVLAPDGAGGVEFRAETGGGGGGRTLISSQSLSGVASVTFSSIPNTYKKLILEVIARSTSAVNGVDLHIQFNSDTTSANYRYALLRYNATGSAVETGANYKIAVTTVPAGSSPSGEHGRHIIEIVEYANANIKKIAQLTNGSGKYDAASVFLQTQNGSMSWDNTNAINAIVVALSAGNGSADSFVNLYGE